MTSLVDMFVSVSKLFHVCDCKCAAACLGQDTHANEIFSLNKTLLVK